MKNRNFKIFIISLITISIIGLFIIIQQNHYQYKNFKKKLIDNNSYIVNAMLENHPELEKELIDNLLTNKNFNQDILIKYGFDINTIGYIDSLNTFNTNFLNSNIIIYLIIISIVFLIYIIYEYKERKKLKQIDQYINDILNNKDTFDIREYSEDYISRLKNDIYKITVLLKEEKEISIKEKQNLEIILSDISHQIRTPLTSMYVINDLLLKDSLDKKSKKDFLNKNRIQVERIEWLVTSLLKISRLDSGTIKLKLEKVKISELLNKTIEPLRIPIELKKQELIIEGNPDLIINIDFNWTLEALVNIIKNAHEHTKIAGTIKITYDTNPIYTEIIIKDNGEGISKKDIKHIFERFYKCDGKESIGIGLNMAKKIIEKENGLIEVESIKEKGTSFHLKFYKIK